MNRMELSSAEFSRMRWELRKREEAIIEQVLQQADYPPLPACPECAVAVEKMESMVEPQKFEVDEQAVLINLKPCGHRFRAVVDLDESM